MRNLVLAAALTLLAVPAFAQTPSPSTTPATPGASSSMPPSANDMVHTLQGDLSKAGYTDIHIIPGSFLVRAKDPRGNPVDMMVSPGSVTEVTAVPVGSGTAGTGAGTGTGTGTGTGGATPGSAPTRQ